MPHKYFSIDGVPTFVHHTGATTLPDVTPDLSRGRTVLCLHGAKGNGALFAELLARLSDQHSPLAFDQPGHGRSGGLDSLGSIERMAGFTAAFASKLGLDRPVLLGHSLGAAVALQCALDRPDAVAALVLCGSAARIEVADEQIDRMRRITEGKERQQFRRELYSPDATPEVMRGGFMQDVKTDPRAGLGDLLAARGFDVEGRLGEIAAPTLVVVGADVDEAARAQSERLSSGIRGASLVEIPQAAHMVPIEQPDTLARAVLEFLAEVA